MTIHEMPAGAQESDSVNAKREGAQSGISDAGLSERLAEFGRLFVLHCYECGDSWWGDEWSEDIMSLAVRAGIAERCAYDPREHGEGIEAEPGDEIWHWTVSFANLSAPPESSPTPCADLSGNEGEVNEPD